MIKNILGKSWSAEEDNILKEFYRKTPKDVILLKLNGRSWCAIQHRISRLGIGIQDSWTEEEDSMLREYYNTGQWNLGKPNGGAVSRHNRAAYLKLKIDRKTLGVIYKNKYFSKNSVQNYGKILGCVVSHAVQGAKQRNFEYSVLDGSIENMKYLDSIAYDFCALSGMPITYKVVCRDKQATASLDRIDSSKGYVKGNVQWIHKDINRLKMDLSEEKFIELCKNVYFNSIKNKND